MVVKEAITKELSIIKDKHLNLLKKANNLRDPHYGMIRLCIYEELESSYGRLIKDIDNDS